MPLLPGKKNIGHNIKEMEAHNHPRNQAVAAALREAYGPRKNRTLGGPTVNGPIQVGEIPSQEQQQQQQAQKKAYYQGYQMSQSGFADGGDTDASEPDDISGKFTGGLQGDTDGRADSVNATVPDGSHVLTSEFVSSLGDGNTEAGMEKLNQMFPDSAAQNKAQKERDKAMKQSMKGPSGGGGIKAASAKPVPAIKLNTVKTGPMPKIPAIAKAGMSQGAGHNIIKANTHMPRAPKMPGMPKGLADGGSAKGVKCRLSHGEYVVSPYDVKHTVGGGDQEEGHAALDMWMMHKRRETIHKLANLPGPVKS